MMKFLRTHLVWKVFLSYVLVVLVGAIILITAASLSVPAAFERHMASMNEIMNNANAMGNNQQMQSELFSQYTTAVYEAVICCTRGLDCSNLESFFISRQVVTLCYT